MIRLLLILLLIPSLASAVGVGRTGAIGDMGGPVASGGGTCTEYAFGGVDDDSTHGIAEAADGSRDYVSGQFAWTETTNTEMQKIQLPLAVSGGDPTGITYNLSIFDSASSDPTTQVTNATCTFDGSLVPSTVGYVGCTTSSAFTLTNGNSYHFVIDAGGDADSTNKIVLYYDKDAGTEDINRSPDGITWTASDTSSTLSLKLFSGSGCSGN